MALTTIEKNIINTITNYTITSVNEIAQFLGQCAHESANFSKLSEGSKYRYKTAINTFASNPSKYQSHANRLKLIKEKQAELKAKDDDFVPQPFLFNTVYGDRMGNEKNGTVDNDGFDFSGAGYIQLTGKDNYIGFQKWLTNLKINIELSEIRKYTQTTEGALLSALYFWLNNLKLRKFAQEGNTLECTKIINGGTNGLDDRIALVKKYTKELK